MLRKISNVLLNDADKLQFDKMQTVIEKGVVEEEEWGDSSLALVVRVDSANGIRDMQTFGRQDPYVVATMLPSYEKRRTLPAFFGGTDPEWSSEEVNTLVLKVDENGDDSDVSDCGSDEYYDPEQGPGQFKVSSGTRTLLLELKNENSLQDDDFIGSATVSHQFAARASVCLQCLVQISTFG
jgi:hypothetical protein